MSKNLGTLPICVEKHVHPHYSKFSSVQRAAFITNTLWDIGTTLNVAFYPLPSQNIPTWYSISEVETQVPQGFQIDSIEYDVRKISNMADAVKYVIQQRLQPLVNVKFNWTNDVNNADVRINFDSTNGSWSYVGKQIQDIDKSKPTMNFGWLDVGTFIHEFCHTLGMIHEHQNPFGKGIQWNVPAVYQWASETQGWDKTVTDTNILDKYNSDSINGSNYDPLSIMLYFYPASLTTNGVGTTENHQLSPTDKQWLSSIYPMSGQRVFPSRGPTSTPTSTPSPTTPISLANLKSLFTYLILAIILLILFLTFKPYLKTFTNRVVFLLIMAVIIYYIIINEQ